MIRVILVMLLIINITYAGSERYFIKFGSFKHLRGLERTIHKMPKSLRSHVNIIRTKGGWYVPFAHYRKSRKGLSSKLKTYKRYFPDACVTHGRKMFKNRVVYKFGKKIHKKSRRKAATKRVSPKKRKYIRKKRTVKPTEITLQHIDIVAKREVHEEEVDYSQKTSIVEPSTFVTPQYEETLAKREVYAEEVDYSQKNRISKPTHVTLQEVDISVDDTTLNIPEQSYSSQNIPSILEALPILSSVTPIRDIGQKNHHSFTKQMLSGNHYYMTYKDPNGGKNLLIKVSFGADSVSYQPVLGDMQMTQAHYVVENNRLYMYAEDFSVNGAYSILDADRNTYFIVSSWMGGKKLNMLRYYYKLNDAKKYLGVTVSSGLSEVLQEGNFDEFFLDEDEY